MDDINIIIIGAKNNETFNVNIIESYNNPKQANQNDIINLCNIYKNRNINIFCLDNYNDIILYNNNISYINDFFKLGDEKYFNKYAHNIVIEFCNMLDEYFINHDYNKQNDKLLNYIDYKFTWLACGCGWDKGFPINTICTIINDKYYTPIDTKSIDSYINAIISTNKIKENNIEETMKPYSQGIYQSLGTILYRGCEADYSSEDVLLELFKIISPSLSNIELIEFEKFLNKELHWNRLNRNIRVNLTYFIYGNVDIIT